MQINRNTYESYFLLYIDHELSSEERAQVEAFVSSNPDLAMELQMLQKTIFNPDHSLVFGDKQDLLRDTTVNPVNETNYQECFVQYLDDELSLQQKEYTRQFVYANPQYQHEFELIQSIQFRPDTKQVFNNKEILYRREKAEKVVTMRWWAIAVAAAVLFAFLGTGWYLESGENSQQTLVHAPTMNGLPPGSSDSNSRVAVLEKKSPDQPADDGFKEIPATINAEKNNADVVAVKPLVRTVRYKETLSKPANISTNSGIQQSNKGAMAINTGNIPGLDDATQIGSVEVLQPGPAMASLSLAIEQSEPVGSQEDALMFLDPEQDLNSNLIFIANTSVSTKNKLRGILRTASRVFEKTASLQPSSEKKVIRIASFEIGLQ